MMELKGCPRCKGDLHYNHDAYGAYKECLQCGYMVDIPRTPELTISIGISRRGRAYGNRTT